MQLTPTEQRLIQILLNKAADEFGNHGCNDFDVVSEAGLTNADSDKLWQALADWDAKELAENVGKSTIHYDWLLMRYFAEKIGKGNV
jgi:hypothetical protein